MKDTLIKKTTGMIAHTVDDLSVNFFKFGIQLRTQLSKKILSYGRFANIAFKYMSLDTKTNKNIGPSMMLATFKSYEGTFIRYSYFIIKNRDQALQIRDLINDWFSL